MERVEEFVKQFLDDYYSSATAATRLHDIFPHNLEGIWNYIKVGRQFWKYNDEKNVFELITITYVRSGVAFYTTERFEEEQFLPKGCIGLCLLYPRVLYLKDIYENSMLNENDKPPYEHLVAMYTKMKLDIPADYVKIDVEK
jgi:hypothetical protein